MKSFIFTTKDTKCTKRSRIRIDFVFFVTFVVKEEPACSIEKS